MFLNIFTIQYHSFLNYYLGTDAFRTFYFSSVYLLIKYHQSNLEQYILYSLTCDLFSRDVETYLHSEYVFRYRWPNRDHEWNKRLRYECVYTLHTYIHCRLYTLHTCMHYIHYTSLYIIGYIRYIFPI